MNLSERWSGILDDLHARGRYRRLIPPGGIDLSSNDYLGYGSGARPFPSDAERWPTSGLASRLLRGNHPLWGQVEDELARWHGAEAALVMTSGYVANEGLLSTVIERHDWAASDERNHASIIDGLRLARAERFVYRHNDLDHLEAGLRRAARDRPADRQLFVVTESLFGMDGDRAPLEELAALARRYGAHVLVDEAHATGCFGPGGSGLVDAARLRGRVLATVHTGGKALGVSGAYVCGPARLKELLVNRCRHLIFTTAPPPAAAPPWLATLRRVRADEAGRRALHAAAAALRSALADRGITAPGEHYVVPVPLGDDRRAVEVAGFLQERGYDVRAVRPPSVPPGTARLRISVHADHPPDLLTAVAAAVAEAVRAASLASLPATLS